MAHSLLIHPLKLNNSTIKCYVIVIFYMAIVQGIIFIFFKLPIFADMRWSLTN